MSNAGRRLALAIRANTPAPQHPPMVGTVASAAPGYYVGSVYVLPRLIVSGVGGDTGPGAAMNFTTCFARDLAELGPAIVGRLVTVLFLSDGQPIADHLIVIGDKSNG